MVTEQTGKQRLNDRLNWLFICCKNGQFKINKGTADARVPDYMVAMP